jgi:formylglycine-generating enzyme required for sulfatase activity
MKRNVLTLLAAAMVFSSPFLALADDAATAAGWSEAILAARPKVQAQLAGRPVPVTTDIRRGSMPAVKLEYDLTGAKELVLVVQSDPDYKAGQAVWGEPELVAADGGIVKLIDLKPVESKTGWGTLQINKNVRGGPLKIANAPIAYGFLAHADSLVRFKLDKPYKTFRTKAGIDDVAGKGGNVRFVISSYDPKTVIDPAILTEINGKYPGLATLTVKELGSTLDAAALRAEASQYLANPPAVAAKPAAAKPAAAKPVAVKSNPLQQQLPLVNPAALRRALDDLAAAAPDRYPDVADLRKQIEAIPADLNALASQAGKGDEAAVKQANGILELKRRILLANPLLDFDKAMAIKRGLGKLGLPANYNSNSSIGPLGYDNEIIEVSLHGKAPVRTIFKPDQGRFAGDLSLHFNGDRFLFSTANDKRQWQVFELKTDGTGLRQATPDLEDGLGNYDACYLPNGDIIYTCTAVMTGVPCVFGGSHVANLFRLSADGKVRQLCFDQEHNWTPRLMPNGTVLYQRWEYTDTPHSNTRLLFTMNPDGTNQREFYGSNSYWPSAFFYATPIPGKPTQVVGISTGHHGPARTGELIILDVAKGRREGSGVVQKIPGFGQKYEAKIYDHMDNVWPNFLHPCPLSDKYFLVACKPSPQHNWGMYLVDIFDNLQLIQEIDGYAVLEPTALMKRPMPAVIPDKVDLKRKDAIVYLQDIYEGPGLQGIPRGTVKALRVFSYTFSYHGVGGLYGVVGQDGPWDLKRVLGTVPVYPDGSAKFRVPANTPIAVQPLDEHGQAMALMRSWMTAMPGEVLSCIGCHETENMVPPSRTSQAFKEEPSDIKPWRPMVSGFSFDREVQPVLDKYCVSCHNDEGASPDLRGGIPLKEWRSVFSGNGGKRAAGRFTTSYSNLFPFVRNNGIEGDYHLLSPMEFHFSTSELGKMLRKGHHGVKLDADAFDRLVVWDDMNRPYHGSWSSIVGTGVIVREDKRAELRKRYANVDENHEAQPAAPNGKIEPVIPEPEKPIINPEIKLADWPFDANKAKALQGDKSEMSLDLGNGMTLALVRIPAGEFVMGSAAGHRDEQPISEVKIKKAFWMGRFEITNAQYRAFDPTHDSRVADALSYQFGQRPFSLNEDKQPVCRISWREAMNYCQWLAKKTGKKVTLPTEAQWEWACRAGSADAYSFGQNNTDYAPYANLGDTSLSKFVLETAFAGYHGVSVHKNPPKSDDYIPKDEKHDDGNQLSAPVGSYKPNAWGLHDMHGDVAEWTRSLYQPYPYKDDARNDIKESGERVVRGGSWWVRPFQCTSSWRIPYQDYQPVMDVGFRIIVEE